VIHIKLKIFFPILVIFALISAGIIGVTSVKAQTSANPVPNLVQMLADKFNLKKTDVQVVFDQYKTNRQSQMETKYKSMLDQAVTAGKITSAQEQLILAKHQELKTSRLKNRQDLLTWANQNNIDPRYLMGRFGHRPFPTPTP
jgi:hypothetical protein